MKKQFEMRCKNVAQYFQDNFSGWSFTIKIRSIIEVYPFEKRLEKFIEA